MGEALGLVFDGVLVEVPEAHVHCRDQSNLAEGGPCSAVETLPGIVLVIDRLWLLGGLEILVWLP